MEWSIDWYKVIFGRGYTMVKEMSPIQRYCLVKSVMLFFFLIILTIIFSYFISTNGYANSANVLSHSNKSLQNDLCVSILNNFINKNALQSTVKSTLRLEEKANIDTMMTEIGSLTNELYTSAQVIKRVVLKMSESRQKAAALISAEMVEKVNKISKNIQYILEKNGVSSYLSYETNAFGQIYLKLFIKAINLRDPSLSPNIRKLGRLQRFFKVNGFIIDYYGSAFTDFIAAYHRDTHMIELGHMGLENLIYGKVFSGILRHEFKHGGFGLGRKMNISSVYNVSYIASNSKNLGNDSYGYTVSAEELYNYMANPFWFSKPLQNVEKMKPHEILYVLDSIIIWFKGNVIMADKFKKLTGEFGEVLEERMRMTKNAGRKKSSNLKLVTFDVENNRTLFAHDVNTADGLIITDKDGRVLNVFIDNKLREKLKLYFTNFSDVEKDEIGKIVKLPMRERAQQFATLLYGKFEDTVPNKDYTLINEIKYEIFEDILNGQKKIGKVADYASKYGKSLHNALVSLTQEFGAAAKLDPDLLATEKWQDKIVDLRLALKMFANAARENYKGSLFARFND